MTTQLKLEHLYPVSAQAFLQCMTEPEMHEYVSSRMSSIKRRLVESHEEGNRRRWVVEVGWHDELPAFARSLLKAEKLRWTQHFEVDMSSGYFSFRVRHPFPPNWFEAHGVGLIANTPDGQTRWSIEVELHSGIPVVGSTVEKTVASKLKEAVLKDMALRQEYVRSKHPSGAAAAGT